MRKRRARRRAVGTRAPILVEAKAERALVARLRPRPVRLRPALPHPQHRRRRDARMPGGDPRHLDLGPAGGARTDDADRAARQAGHDRLRQRHRVHLERHAGLGEGSSGRLALHRAGQADAERLLRELQRPHARRASQRDACSSISITPGPRSRTGSPTTTSERPHSSLGYLTPAAYAANLTATGDRLRNPDQLRRSPVAPPAPHGVKPAEALIAAG